MLIDMKFPKVDPARGLGMLLSMIGGESDPHPTRLREGVYQIAHWSFDMFLSKEHWDEYPDLQLGDEYTSPYGVCDSLEQFMGKIGDWLDGQLDPFIVSLTPVRKVDQSKDGGWRWHKWGPYIGEQEPTTEYLHDEPNIDEVFCYHIYKGEAIIHKMEVTDG